jgi:hypothetical protein
MGSHFLPFSPGEISVQGRRYYIAYNETYPRSKPKLKARGAFSFSIAEKTWSTMRAIKCHVTNRGETIQPVQVWYSLFIFLI